MGRSRTAGVAAVDALLAVIMLAGVVSLTLPLAVDRERSRSAEGVRRVAEGLATAIVAYRTDESYLRDASYGTWPQLWSDLNGTGVRSEDYVGELSVTAADYYEVLTPFCQSGDDAPCPVRVRLRTPATPEADALRVAALLSPRATIDTVDAQVVVMLLDVPGQESVHDNFGLVDGGRPFQGRTTFGEGECAPAPGACVVIDPAGGQVILQPTLLVGDAIFDGTLEAGSVDASAGELEVTGQALVDAVHADTFRYDPP